MRKTFQFTTVWLSGCCCPKAPWSVSRASPSQNSRVECAALVFSYYKHTDQYHVTTRTVKVGRALFVIIWFFKHNSSLPQKTVAERIPSFADKVLSLCSILFSYLFFWQMSGFGQLSLIAFPLLTLSLFFLHLELVLTYKQYSVH